MLLSGGFELAGLPDLPTPCLLLDEAVLHDNMTTMAALASTAKGRLRPHAKTHKCAEIARRQMALGALGIACATLAEAEAMAAGGIADVLITSPVVGAGKLERLAALAARTRLSLVVDHAEQVDALAGRFGTAAPLDLLIDVDPGMQRTGVAHAACAIALARRIAATPGLRFAGVQGYAGHVQHVFAAAERRTAVAQANAIVAGIVTALREAGFPPGTVSGSGTGSFALDAGGGLFTEHQVGSYVFMDAEYARVRDDEDKPLPFRHALFVLGTVVSANHLGLVTVDAGTKAIATNGPPPDRFIGAPPGTAYRYGGDEHGILSLPANATPPGIGARIAMVVSHCDPTVNLFDAYHVVRDGKVVDRWAIEGRYGAA
jgi:D-serine deaminase-like pyridoxal phosphate-dependent protein